MAERDRGNRGLKACVRVVVTGVEVGESEPDIRRDVDEQRIKGSHFVPYIAEDI